jgi:NADH:ubiquinone oxidoreductase subunit
VRGEGHLLTAPALARTGRPRRVVDLSTPSRQGTDYDPAVVPAAWQAWLQHRRAAPPTLDDLRADVQRTAAVQAAAAHSAAHHAETRATLHEEHARLHAAAVASASPAPGIGMPPPDALAHARYGAR